MATTYRVTTAALIDDVVTLGLVTVVGLHAGFHVTVDAIGSPFDGNFTLTAVDEDDLTVTYAKNHPNDHPEQDTWGQLELTVTWCDTQDVEAFLGVAPAEQVDEDWLDACTVAGNQWCWDRRQAAGYQDLPQVAPSHKVKQGAVLKVAELYRQRGSIDGFSSFQALESVAPVATNIEVLRLLGINRPAIA